MIKTLSCPNRCDKIVFSSIHAYASLIIGKYSVARCFNTTRIPIANILQNIQKLHI